MPRISRILFILVIILFFSSCSLINKDYNLAKAKHVGHLPYYSVEEVQSHYSDQSSPRLDLVITKEIEYSINHFLTVDPNYLAIAQNNRNKYEPKVSQIFKQHNLPLELLHAAAIESMFKNKSRSHYGAVGVWQFLPATARHCGLKISLLSDQRKDPYLSTEAAACYLLELYAQFQDWRWALAAYNYGPYRIRKFQQQYPHLDFWQIARFKSFPSQTKAYVSRVFAAAILDNQRIKPRFYSRRESANILAAIRKLYPFV